MAPRKGKQKVDAIPKREDIHQDLTTPTRRVSSRRKQRSESPSKKLQRMKDGAPDNSAATKKRTTNPSSGSKYFKRTECKSEITPPKDEDDAFESIVRKPNKRKNSKAPASKKGRNKLGADEPPSKKPATDYSSSNREPSETSVLCETELLVRNGELVDLSVLSKQAGTTELCSEMNDNDDSDSDWEEVVDEPEKSQIPDEPVEITIDGPLLQKKRQKKKFDMEDWFRRQVNKHKKDLQVNTHKVHLICLLTNGCHRNNMCLEDTLKAFALSNIPSTFIKKEPRFWGVSELKNITSWFTGEFKIKAKPERDYPVSEESLLETISSKCVPSDVMLVMVFVITARSLGLDTRLVFSFQPVTAKAQHLISKESTLGSSDDRFAGDIRVNDADKTYDSLVPGKCKGKDKGKSLQKSTGLSGSAKSSKNKSKVKTTEAAESTSNARGKRNASRKCTQTVKNSHSDKHATVSPKASPSDVLDVSSDDDFDVVLTKFRTPPSSKKKKSRKVLSSDSDDDDKKKGNDCWAEVYIENIQTWVCVDCVRNRVHHASEMEEHTTKPMYYVIAYDNDTAVKDVTKKYASVWMAFTRKLRVDDEWWDDTMRPYCSQKGERDATEDLQIQGHLMKKPLPTSIGEYKGHPLYALKRHLLKFEGIYPNSAVPLGFVRNEPVYARECVHMLHSRETWLKEGRLVRIGEEPYKMVKARPKWWKTEPAPIEPTLPLFGLWQTEVYIPPPAFNGKVPRNEYGNVELFKPEMLPGGTVHLQLPGLNKIAKKLDIDCVPAMVGWDFHGGYNHAVHDGFVVCEEFKDILLAAWDEDQEIQKEKEAEKREKRVLSNWKLLCRGLIIRERMKHRFDLKDKKDEFKEGGSSSTSHKKATDTELAWPRNRQCEDKKAKRKRKKKEAAPLFPFEVEEM